MNRLDEVDGHISESIHVREQFVDHFDGVFNWLVNIDHSETLAFGVLHYDFIFLWVFLEIYLLESLQNILDFGEFPLDLINAFFPWLYGDVHLMEKAFSLQQILILSLQFFLDFFKGPGLNLWQEGIIVEWIKFGKEFFNVEDVCGCGGLRFKILGVFLVAQLAGVIRFVILLTVWHRCYIYWANK